LVLDLASASSEDWWGWGHWGYDWHGRRAFFDHHEFVSHSRDFGHEGSITGDFAT